MFKRKQLLVLFLFCVSALSSVGQQERTGSALFLTLSPEARSAGMGGANIAVINNTFSIFNNPSSSLFAPKGFSIATAYSSWIRADESESMLTSVGGYFKFSDDQSIGMGFRYFTAPKVSITDENGNITGRFRPKEWALDLSYSRLFTENFGASLTGRYIHSDLYHANGSKAGWAVAFDLAMIYYDHISSFDGAHWSLGLKLANIGTKIKYREQSYELPGKATIGTSAYLPLSEQHQLRGALDIGYRFLPSDIAHIDASVGLEYYLFRYIILRGGYHAGDKKKGDENFTTVGCGLRFKAVHLDFSYRLADSDSALKDTWNLSVGFNL